MPFDDDHQEKICNKIERQILKQNQIEGRISNEKHEKTFGTEFAPPIDIRYGFCCGIL